MAITVVGALTGAEVNTTEGDVDVSVPLPAGAQEGDRFVIMGAALRTTVLPSGWTRADEQYLGSGNWRSIVDTFDVGAAAAPTNYVTTLDTAETGTPRWAYGAFLLRGVDLDATVLSATQGTSTAPSVTSVSAGSVELRSWHRVGERILPVDTFDNTLNVYDEPDLAGRMFTYVAGNVDVGTGAVGSAESTASGSAAGQTVVMSPITEVSSPSDVVLSASQIAAVAMEWNATVGPYKVLRDSSELASGVSGTTFVDTSVEPGTSYVFEIEDGNLDMSNPVTVNVTAQGGVFFLRRDGSGWSATPA